MKVLLTSYMTGYLLTPCNVKTCRKLKRETGEESALFQTDFDFPGLAESLGWKSRLLDNYRNGASGNLGKVIHAAGEWLERHDGYTFRRDVEAYFQL